MKKQIKKINLVAYWRYGLLTVIMLTWLIARFLLKKSELYIIPAVLVYLALSAVICRGYFIGMIGNYFYMTRKPDKAMKYYEKAVKMKTYNIKALYNYGLDKLHQNKPEEALPVLEKAEKLNTKPLFEKLIPLAVSSCYWLLGDIDRAIDILEGLQKKYSYINCSTLVTLGYFYMLKNDYDKAEEITKKAIKDNPSSASAYDNLGQIYYNRQDYKKAEEYFLKAVELKENTVESLYYLALIKKSENKTDEARELLEKASGCYISGLNTISPEDIKRELNNIELLK